VLVISRTMFLNVALASATALFMAPYPAKALQAAAQSGQATWKDQAESDLYQAISKETDPQKKIALFQQWKEKYASSQMGAYFIPQYVQAIQGLAAPIGALFGTATPTADGYQTFTAISFDDRLRVPLKNMCSRKWDIPFVSCGS